MTGQSVGNNIRTTDHRGHDSAIWIDDVDLFALAQGQVRHRST